MERINWKRKFWHVIGGLIIAAIICYLQKGYAVIVLSSMLVLVGFPDVLRLYLPRLNEKLIAVFGFLGRKEEEHSLNTSTMFLLGSWLVAIFFPKTIAVTAILMLTLGDPVEELMRQYGKIRIFKQKTLEGSLACFMVCLLVGLLVLKSFPLAVAGAIGATLAEIFTFRKFDNLTMPLASSLIMTLAITFL